MSQAMADEILANRKGNDKKMNPQEYLIKYVNEQFDLRLPVSKVGTSL